MSLSPFLIDTEEVSRLTGIPVATLKYYRKVNLGPPWARIGKHIKYRPDDVKAWVDAKFPKPAAPTAEG